MFFTTENILLIGSILLFVSLIVGKTGYRFGVPALLLFLLVGMLFGSDGLGIQFNNPGQAQFIGMIALSIILFSGGMDTKMSEIRPVLGEGVVLATAGVFMTAFITGAFVYWISAKTGQHIALTLIESLLLASVMSSTDSASVFSILRSKNLHLKYNLRPMLELESGSNDPMAYLLTILFIQMIQSADMGIGQLAGELVMQLSVGALCGYFLGRLAILILNKINIQYESLYPVLLLSLVFFVFSFTNLLRGNGYLAVYIAGVVVGNRPFIHKKKCHIILRRLCLAMPDHHVSDPGIIGQSARASGSIEPRSPGRYIPHSDCPPGKCFSMPVTLPETAFKRTAFRILGRSSRSRTHYFCNLSANCRYPSSQSDLQCRILHHNIIPRRSRYEHTLGSQSASLSLAGTQNRQHVRG